MGKLFGGRVVSRARIECPNICVDEVVKDDKISFTISNVDAIDRDFGILRELIVENTNVRCSTSMFSPYRMLKLENDTIQAMSDALESGDFVKCYIAVLDDIASKISLEMALNPYGERNREMEELLVTISDIRENMLVGKVVEDPSVILKRMRSSARLAFA